MSRCQEMSDHDESSHCYRVPATRVTRAELHRQAGWKPPPGNGDEMIETPAMFLCGQLGEPCATCGDVADALCDFAIGDEARTCDAAICSRCSPMIGANRNYCIPHAADGPGMLLFDLPRSAPAYRIAVSKPRLPRAPVPLRRWRAVAFEPVAGLAAWRVCSGWTDEISARRASRRVVDGEVQTWDEFVAWHRSLWPLKRRTTT